MFEVMFVCLWFWLENIFIITVWTFLPLTPRKNINSLLVWESFIQTLSNHLSINSKQIQTNWIVCCWIIASSVFSWVEIAYDADTFCIGSEQKIICIPHFQCSKKRFRILLSFAQMFTFKSSSVYFRISFFFSHVNIESIRQ